MSSASQKRKSALRHAAGMLKWQLTEVWPARFRQARMPALRRHWSQRLTELKSVPPSGDPLDLEIHMLCGEAMAAGCVVVGRKPSTPFVQEMFPWEDALIDLPDGPAVAVDAVLDLLGDADRLRHASQRNMREMAKRHDWRHRVRTVMDVLGCAPQVGSGCGDTSLEGIGHGVHA